MAENDNKIIRRTFELAADRKEDLERIKAGLDAKTDTAALNFAVRQAGRLASRAPGEVEAALSFWDELTREVKEGGSVVIENDRNKEHPRTKLALPIFSRRS